MASAKTRAKLSASLKKYHRTGRKKPTLKGHVVKGLGYGGIAGTGLGAIAGGLMGAPFGPAGILGGALGGGFGGGINGAATGGVGGAGIYGARKVLRHRNYSSGAALSCFSYSGVNLLRHF